MRRLRQVFEVRIRVHYSWNVGFVLMIVLVVTQFPDTYYLWQRIITGMVGSLTIFAAVALRQFILSLTAVGTGVPVRNATLFVFGGLCPVPSAGTRRSLELLLGATGLLSNFVIGGVFYWLYLGSIGSEQALTAGLAQWLVFMWGTIVVLHFMPIYPLDAGRLVSAALWRGTGSYYPVIRGMAWAGRGVGLLSFAAGVWLMVTSPEWITGILPAFWGWVLQAAAAEGRRRTATLETLQSVHARDIMTREFSPVIPEVTLEQLVRNYALVTGQHFFVVAQEGKLLGILTLRTIRSIPRKRWVSTRASRVMIPARKARTVRSDESVATVLEKMDQWRMSDMPVLDQDKLVGAATRDGLLRLARTRATLGIGGW